MPVFNMTELTTIDWILLTIAVICVVNFFMVFRAGSKNHLLKAEIYSQKSRIHELEDDVKTLYESAVTFGEKLQSLEQSSRVLKEQQEQLSLKEPNQQTYRNAIHAIHNGDTVNEVADSSGLSRGEVELLKLLQKINGKTEEKMT